MAKFIMECPRCKKAIEVSTGFFAKKEITCPDCQKKINIALEKLAEETCPRCGGKVVYDRTNPSAAICPTCHTNIKEGKKEEITCPKCLAHLTVDTNAKTFTCPQCKVAFDVQARLAQKESSKTAQVVEWVGENGVFIYRHPMENFKLGSRVNVGTHQKAVFVRNGQMLDIFGEGAHILETQNLPLMEEILKYPTDADLTFSSKVYFVRTDGVMSVKWWIPEMKLRNPGMDFYVDVSASGSANIKVMEGNENVKKFLSQVIGTATDGVIEKYDEKYLSVKFRDYITTRLGSLLAEIILSSNINVLDLASKRATISDMLVKDYNELLEEYGLMIPPKQFMVTRIDPVITPEVEKWIRQESDKVLKVRDEGVLKAEAEARQGRVLVEEQTEIQRNILRTQGAGEVRKISAMAGADVTRIETQGSADAARIGAQGSADATLISSKANAEATLLTSRAEAEATRLTGQASAEAYKAQAIAEAEEMHAKGYTYAQETSRQIGLEALQNGLPGTGNGGGGGGGSSSSGAIGNALGDMIGLGVSLGTMGSVAKMTKDMINPIMGQVADIGNQPTQTVAPQTNLVSAWNCSCGKSCITTKFCPECGSPKPVAVENGLWNCTCGQTGIGSNFCPNCGARKPADNGSWTCTNCGQTDITTNFCPDCGNKKG